MATHFLLQAKARSLSIRDVFAMSEDDAFDKFCELLTSPHRVVRVEC